MLGASHEADGRRFHRQCNFYNWSKCVEFSAVAGTDARKVYGQNLTNRDIAGSTTRSATPTRSRIPTARKGTLGSSGILLFSEVGRTCWQKSSGRRQRPTRRRVQRCPADKNPSHLYRPRKPLGSIVGLIAGQETAAPRCGRKRQRKQKQVARGPEATSCTTAFSKRGRTASIISLRFRFRRLPSRWRRRRCGMKVSKVSLQFSHELRVPS